MKNFKTFLAKNLFIISFTLLFVGCSKNDSPIPDQVENNSITTKSQRRASSGEDIFKAIFFGIGQDLTNMKQLKYRNDLVEKMKVNEKAEYLERINNLVAIIKTDNIEFFDKFRFEIISGEHSRVENAINDAGNKIFSRITMVFPEMQPIINSNRQNVCEGTIEDASNSGNINKYIEDQIYLPEHRPRLNRNFEGLVENNMISNNAQRPCSFGIVCVAGFYFAVVAHNTIGLSAVAAVYLAVTFVGPSIQSWTPSGGTGGLTRPSPLMNDVPQNTTEANLRFGILIDEITLNYA